MDTTEIRLVEWLDAVASSGWNNEAIEPTVNYSIGYVLQDNVEYVQLAGTICGNDGGYYNNAISIPRGMIVKETTLNETKQRKAKRKTTATVSDEEVARLISAIYGEGYQINSDGSEQCGCPDEPSCPWSTRISD